ncbi:unnamed protein product [Prunus armeniaca]|uniref:Uncharacterized protein n=1 Tax=Prunus armeniaca TaxID=36596 RepID=A0A6J5WHW2_PRUAR|nr:unnamed protein product [Prunus armeniaca]
MESLHLAEGLASHRDIATGPLVLGAFVDGANLATMNGRDLQVALDVMPLRDLILNSVSGKTTEECFTFFMGRKNRSVTQWMMNLKRSCSWFADRLIYQAPKDANNSLASGNMDFFSCLQSLDLPCGGRMDSRNYQYGVKAYNPQFFSRQLRCPQVIPELNYSLINRGSSYRFPKLSREDLLQVRAKYEESARALELKPYQPICCGTLPF